MRHDFALKFEPHGGGAVVPAKACAATLDAVLDGLGSLRNATAPLIALYRGWPAAQVRDALQVAIGPTARGSLIVPLVVGAQGPAAHLDADVLASTYWRLSTRLLRQTGEGRSGAVDVAASCAEAFEDLVSDHELARGALRDVWGDGGGAGVSRWAATPAELMRVLFDTNVVSYWMADTPEFRAPLTLSLSAPRSRLSLSSPNAQ